MARIERPANDRNDAELQCWELPGTPSDEPVSCPLLQSVFLLPIRYGRTETAPEGASMPYQLKSRPLGYRLLRNGYLYILDEDAGELHEYLHENNELSGHNGGRLEYLKSHTLYVSFSDIAWTERKKAQVLDSAEDRQWFMQKIDLSSASPMSGGEHLLTPDQARESVAEFSEDYTPEPPEGAHSQESEPYHWENQPYYHQTGFGKLIKQQEIDDPSNCLCLVVQDDVGVMLDLAKHQDDVVGWIEEWKESGNTERDYVVGAWIESLTTLNDTVLEGAAGSTGNEQFQSLYDDTTEAQRQKIYEYLDVRKDYRGPQPMGPEDYLREHHGDNPLVKTQLAMVDSLGQALYETHRDAINQLNLRNYHLLNGAKLGQRGINDLIDRPRMLEFMDAQRTKLARWSGLLTNITDDRVTMLCDSRFHKAAWYFDGNDDEQLEASLDLQYACLKDICRSDNAAERVLTWMEESPQHSHPSFHTLPLADQSPEAEPLLTYLTVKKVGYSVVTSATEWTQRLTDADADRLPDIEARSTGIQQKAAAIGDTLAPAMSLAISKTMDELYKGLDGDRLPPLDDLFRDLPFFFKRKMLSAIKAGEVEFRISSADELETFRRNVEQVMALNEKLGELNSEHERIKATHGHRSDRAQSLVAEFKATREEQRALSDRLVGALSPVEEVGGGLNLEPATTGKAGLVLMLPAMEQQQIGSILSHYRQGLTSAPRVNLLGDGLGVLVFVAQMVNLWGVSKEWASDTSDSKATVEFIDRIAATSAAGFLAAQGISDTVLSARANELASAWSRNALKSVHINMGKLHVGLGILAYGAGGFAAALSTFKHAGNWVEAVKAGNAGAQVGAVLGMVGSSGLTVTNFYGLGRSFQMGVAAIGASDAAASSAAWAVAGTRLSSLFARLNLVGLIFTVFELGGTWLYNRYNLSKQDQWLLSTPWTTDPERNSDLSLDDYQASLLALGRTVSLSRNQLSGENGGERMVLHCHSLPADAVKHIPGVEPRFRLWIAAWRTHPAHTSMFQRAPETWVSAAGPILQSLRVSIDSDHLQLEFSPPEHEKSKHGMLTRELVLMLKMESRRPEGGYEEAVYFLKVDDDSEVILPIDDEPAADPVWRRIQQPLIELDIYQ